jgi:hypothetical protein
MSCHFGLHIHVTTVALPDEYMTGCWNKCIMWSPTNVTFHKIVIRLNVIPFGLWPLSKFKVNQNVSEAGSVSVFNAKRELLCWDP